MSNSHGILLEPSTLNKLLKELFERAASDLHLRTNHPPYLRLHGKLFRSESIDSLNILQMIQLLDSLMELRVSNRSSADHIDSTEISIYLKDLDSERAKLWEELRTRGSVNFSLETPHILTRELTRFRAACFKDENGFSVCLRHHSSLNGQLDQAGFGSVAIQWMRKALQRPSGLILITGPTGSGKTTTLNCLLNEIIQSRSPHVVTIEDPIELTPSCKPNKNLAYLVTQRDAHLHCCSFREGLNDALRQDPDIILVGEIRTRETLEAALIAAETGHLVMGTLHTSGGYQTITRIISEFEKERHEYVSRQLAHNLILIISQRLLPRAKNSGLIICYELLEITGAIKAALMTGQPDRIPNSMSPENSLRWNTQLHRLFDQEDISLHTFENNRLPDQD